MHGPPRVTGPLPVPPPTPVRLIPAIRVDPPLLDFSSDRRPQSVYVTNTGTGTLQIKVNLGGPNLDRFTSDAEGCSGQIQSGQRCSILVKFNPRLLAPKKSYSAQLDIAHNAPNMTTQSVALRCNRREIVRAHVRVTPSSLDFSPPSQVSAMRIAARAPQAQQTVTILNDGPVALTQLNLRIGFSDQSTAFSHTSNCTQLAKNQPCIETVTFTPADKITYSERLYIFEGLLEQLATVDLQATLPRPAVPRGRKVPQGEKKKVVSRPNLVVQ